MSAGKGGDDSIVDKQMNECLELDGELFSFGQDVQTDGKCVCNAWFCCRFRQYLFRKGLLYTLVNSRINDLRSIDIAG